MLEFSHHAKIVVIAGVEHDPACNYLAMSLLLSLILSMQE